MSQVKRWYIGVYGGEAQARTCSPFPYEVIRASEGDTFVLSRDHNAVLAREASLQQHLTAADERADVQETALKKISARCVAYIEAEREMPEPSVEVCQMIASTALKAAEGGGDESAHDRAYRNGLMQGYNLALNGSEKEYQDAVARYSGVKDAE